MHTIDSLLLLLLLLTITKCGCVQFIEWMAIKVSRVLERRKKRKIATSVHWCASYNNEKARWPQYLLRIPILPTLNGILLRYEIDSHSTDANASTPTQTHQHRHTCIVTECCCDWILNANENHIITIQHKVENFSLSLSILIVNH